MLETENWWVILFSEDRLVTLMTQKLSLWNAMWVFMLFSANMAICGGNLTWAPCSDEPSSRCSCRNTHSELQGHASIFIPHSRHFRALTKAEWGDETREEAAFRKRQMILCACTADLAPAGAVCSCQHFGGFSLLSLLSLRYLCVIRTPLSLCGICNRRSKSGLLISTFLG